MAQTPDPLMSAFIAEAEDLLTRMEDGLLALETAPDNAEVLNGIFRAGHTLKGSAGLLSLDVVVTFTHVLENVLDRLRKQEIAVDQDLVSLLLDGRDVLQRLVACVAHDRAVEVDDDHDRVLASLRQYAGAAVSTPRRATATSSASTPEEQRERVWRIGLNLREDLLETGQDPLMLMLDLSDLGELLEVASDADRLPAFTELEVQKIYLSWRVLLRTQASRRAVEEVFAFVRNDSRIEIAEVMNCDHFT